MTTRENLISERISDADKKKILELLDQLTALLPLNPLSDDEQRSLAKPSDEQLDALKTIFNVAHSNKALFDPIFDEKETEDDLSLVSALDIVMPRIDAITKGLAGTRALVRSDLARVGENVYDHAQRYSERLAPGSDVALEPARKFYGRRARKRR